MSTQMHRSLKAISRALIGDGIKSVSPLDQRRSKSTRPSVLLTHFEPNESKISDVLQRAQNVWGARPIIVITASNVRPLLGTGIAFEHLPAINQIKSHPESGNWEVYLRQRWRMIQTKWQPLYTIHMGLSYDNYVKGCLMSLSRKDVGSK